METVKIPLSHLPKIEQYCFIERGEKYYLAYENEPTILKSVLWTNLDFINKHFSNENGDVTKESLNVRRIHQIKEYELCLKHNCVMSELDKVDMETGELKTYVNEKGGTVKKQIQYKLYDNKNNIHTNQIHPYYVPKSEHYFNREIAKGLYVLCEIVNDTPNYDI